MTKSNFHHSSLALILQSSPVSGKSFWTDVRLSFSFKFPLPETPSHILPFRLPSLTVAIPHPERPSHHVFSHHLLQLPSSTPDIVYSLPQQHDQDVGKHRITSRGAERTASSEHRMLSLCRGPHQRQLLLVPRRFGPRRCGRRPKRSSHLEPHRQKQAW